MSTTSNSLASTSTDVHSAVPSSSLSSALDVSGKDSRVKRKQRRQLCSICQNEDVVCAVQPCYHRSSCESCAAGILTSCPICRGPIDSWVRIFGCGYESDSDWMSRCLHEAALLFLPRVATTASLCTACSIYVVVRCGITPTGSASHDASVYKSL